METLKKQYQRLIKSVSLKHIRGLYNEISWDARLIGIKGARGVGKTTLMLQRIKLAFPDLSKALYVSLDDIWFANQSLVNLAENAESAGITHIFIDEVHRLPGWERQIKNIYDFYPNLHVVFTGSSLLEIDHSIADLSRRSLIYDLNGLSFREFLEFQDIQFPKLTLHEIIYSHTQHANSIASNIDVLKYFKEYLRHGYYPFYNNEPEADYFTRVRNIITTVIDYDLPAVERLEYTTLLKAKQLTTIFASQTPSPLNLKSTSEMLGVSTNQLIKIFSLLDRAKIFRLLYYKTERNPKSMAKPQKVLFNNTSLLYALGNADTGKVRETFMASMLSSCHEVAYPQNGDLIVENRYLFEVGGANKGFNQIKDIPDSFIAADDIVFGIGNKIPLWLFGFLY